MYQKEQIKDNQIQMHQEKMKLTQILAVVKIIHKTLKEVMDCQRAFMVEEAEGRYYQYHKYSNKV